jgi:hypothetical protein
MAHLAVAVKVNGWADEEVAPLVVALNGLAEVVSLDSCQDSRDIGGAYVMFVSGDAELPTARLVERLAIDLAKRLRDVPYRLRLEWFAGGDDPVGYLVSPPEFRGGYRLEYRPRGSGHEWVYSNCDRDASSGCWRGTVADALERVRNSRNGMGHRDVPAVEPERLRDAREKIQRAQERLRELTIMLEEM